MDSFGTGNSERPGGCGSNRIVPGGRERKKEIAALHRRWLTVTGNHYDPDLLRGLAELYVSDGRFTAYYDKTIPGCARFCGMPSPAGPVKSEAR